ncbi:hypothetical protein [Pandoravirus japonicus]|uniref:Uncharacterized protein n=1 Tax=Pandoravirus japonicus TaxID=2823154 RepID=A0A811BMD8_9VIRU|nr:hypothetical protein [Pandoravirus japonicus]
MPSIPASPLSGWVSPVARTRHFFYFARLSTCNPSLFSLLFFLLAFSWSYIFRWPKRKKSRGRAGQQDRRIGRRHIAPCLYGCWLVDKGAHGNGFFSMQAAKEALYRYNGPVGQRAFFFSLAAVTPSSRDREGRGDRRNGHRAERICDTLV